LKLFGGGALALFVSRPQAPTFRWFLGAAAVALGANVGNLFDRAPGRCLKVGALSLAAVLLSTIGVTAFFGATVGCFLGVLVGLLPGDLAENTMLGDTGSNVVGAAVALLAVLRLDDQPTSVMVALVAVLFLLNLASEFVSFSTVIDSVAPLRWFDRLGATPERKAWGRPPKRSVGP
jgi:hypothetical protein